MIRPMDNYNIFDTPTSVYKLNGYSLQELLSQFYKHIQDVINGVNNNEIDIRNFKDEVSRRLEAQDIKLEEMNEWLRGEGLQEEVINQIQLMYDDGRLADIINEQIFTELNNKVNDVVLQVDNLEVKHGEDVERIDEELIKINLKVDEVAILTGFPKLDNETDDTGRLQRALDTGKTVYIPAGNYTSKEVFVRTEGQRIVGTKGSVINHSSHLFTIESGVKYVTIEGFTIKGNLKVAELIAVDSADFNRLKFNQNVFQIGDEISGSNIKSVSQMDTKRAKITAFDGEYYTADMLQFGFDGNVNNKNREYFPNNMGTFEWTTAIRGKGLNHGISILDMYISGERGYYIQLLNTSDVRILDNTFENNGMDMMNFGLNTIDVKNYYVERNIFRNQLNFGKQGIYMSSKSNKIENFYLRENTIEKCTESFLSFFYSDCVFENLVVKDNSFTDVDLFAVTGCGRNITLDNNSFKTVAFTNASKTSMARTCVDIGHFDRGYVANVVVPYENITIINNKFYGATAIGVRTINESVTPVNVTIENNVCNVQRGGIEASGIDLLIKENVINSVEVADPVYQWCGLFINGISDKVRITENSFTGQTRVRFSQIIEKELKLEIDNNKFFGGFCFIGGNKNALQNYDLIVINCHDNFVDTTEIYIDSTPKSVYYNNKFISDTKIIEIPFIRNLSDMRYMSNKTVPTESWRNSVTSAWQSQYFKLGDKFYLVKAGKERFYGLVNDVYFDGTNMNVVTVEGLQV